MSQLQRGVLAMLINIFCGAGMYVLGKVALEGIDPYYMALIRYCLASAILLVMLWLSEGGRPLAAFWRDPRRGWMMFYGNIGIAGFSLLVFEGLRSISSAQAAVIAAMQPLVTALMLWALRGLRPPRMTLFCVFLAFFGVVLVVSKGDLQTLSRGGEVGGALLVFLGVVCWVAYALGVARFPDWSPLRYTTLCSISAVVGIAVCTLIATALGHAHLPSPAQLASVGWELAFLVVMSSVVAAVLWNVGVRFLGPLNAALFINFIPVIVFVLAALQGRPSTAAEYLGGAIVLAALVGNNLFARWQLRRSAVSAGL